MFDVTFNQRHFQLIGMWWPYYGQDIKIYVLLGTYVIHIMYVFNNYWTSVLIQKKLGSVDF